MASRNLFVWALIGASLSASLGFLEQTPEINLPLEVGNLMTQVKGLQAALTNLTGLLKTCSVDLVNNQQALATSLAALNSTIHNPKSVGFMATLSNKVTQLGPGQHLAFDHEVTNDGNHYDTSNGHFTAPYSGIYAFFLTMTNLPKYSTSIMLVKNGQLLTHTVSYGSNVTGSNMETSTIASVINLQKGDEVWAQNEGPYTLHEGLAGGYFSSFSGHLVTPIF